MAQPMSANASNNITDLDNSSTNNGTYMRNHLDHEAEIVLKNKSNQDTRQHDNESNNNEIVAHLYALMKVYLICIKV